MTDHKPRPATAHMPFPGHRTVAEVWEQQERTARRTRAEQYGFDPRSLKAKR